MERLTLYDVGEDENALFDADETFNFRQERTLVIQLRAQCQLLARRDCSLVLHSRLCKHGTVSDVNNTSNCNVHC